MVHRIFCRKLIISSHLVQAEGKYSMKYTDTVCKHGVKKGFFTLP